MKTISIVLQRESDNQMFQANVHINAHDLTHAWIITESQRIVYSIHKPVKDRDFKTDLINTTIETIKLSFPSFSIYSMMLHVSVIDEFLRTIEEVRTERQYNIMKVVLFAKDRKNEQYTAYITTDINTPCRATIECKELNLKQSFNIALYDRELSLENFKDAYLKCVHQYIKYHIFNYTDDFYMLNIDECKDYLFDLRH